MEKEQEQEQEQQKEKEKRWTRHLKNQAAQLILDDKTRRLRNDIGRLFKKYVVSILADSLSLSPQEIKIYVVGSGSTFFCTRYSDLDLVLSIESQKGIDDHHHHPSYLLGLVSSFLSPLLTSSSFSSDFELVEVLLSARVPVLRVRHRLTCLSIDMTMANSSPSNQLEAISFYNQTLNDYARQDERVIEMVVLFKAFLMEKQVKEAREGYINSTGWLNIMINFLKHRRVLRHNDEKDEKDEKTKNTKQNKNKNKNKTRPKNTQSLAALWIDWFYFLNYELFGRKGVQFLTDDFSNNNNQKKKEKIFFIKDLYPLQYNNLAASVTRQGWMTLKAIIEETYHFLIK